MATAKKNGLGKGLDSLITNKVNNAKTTTATIKPAVKKDEKVVEGILVNINKVEPNREQPRKNFDEDALLDPAALRAAYRCRYEAVGPVYYGHLFLCDQ